MYGVIDFFLVLKEKYWLHHYLCLGESFRSKVFKMTQ